MKVDIEIKFTIFETTNGRSFCGCLMTVFEIVFEAVFETIFETNFTIFEITCGSLMDFTKGQ